MVPNQWRETQKNRYRAKRASFPRYKQGFDPESIKRAARERWTAAQNAKHNEATRLMVEEESSMTGIHLNDLLDGEQNIEIVSKESVFASEVTDKEKDIINLRVAEKQKQFQEWKKRDDSTKCRRILAVLDYLTEEEALVALEDSTEQEDEAVANLMNHRYLQEIRMKIARKHGGVGDYNERVVRKRRQRRAARSTTEKVAESQYENRRLLLDDALKDTVNFEGWSPARIKAWKNRGQNANAYYYRFNAPGQGQRTGKWSPEEQALFFRRRDEIGVDGQWGIFSMSIPGRVGYQCSNFYRQLLKEGTVEDENYYFDAQGVLRYKFKTPRSGSGKKVVGKREHSDDVGYDYVPFNAPSSKRVKASPKRKPKKKKRTWSDSDYSEDEWEMGGDDHDYTYHSSTRGVSEDPKVANPLPGFVDPITLEEVEQPAISPFGHVMGYQTWVRTLMQDITKNTCPFTKQSMTKRQLVVLTHDNIEEYRNKIVAF